MIRSLVASSLALLAGCAASPTSGYKTVPQQDVQRVEQEMCEKVACVYDARIVLKKKDGSIFDKSFHTLPVVQPEGVAVYAGQTVLFEAEAQGDGLANFRLVTSNTNPEKTLSATLEQSDKGSMMLTLKNPFKRSIKVSMGIMPLDSDKLLKTSSCPVVASGGSFEMWPYPLFQVWLGNMRFLKEGEGMTCSE